GLHSAQHEHELFDRYRRGSGYSGHRRGPTAAQFDKRIPALHLLRPLFRQDHQPADLFDDDRAADLLQSAAQQAAPRVDEPRTAPEWRLFQGYRWHPALDAQRLFRDRLSPPARLAANLDRHRLLDAA